MLRRKLYTFGEEKAMVDYIIKNKFHDRIRTQTLFDEIAANKLKERDRGNQQGPYHSRGSMERSKDLAWHRIFVQQVVCIGRNSKSLKKKFSTIILEIQKYCDYKNANILRNIWNRSSRKNLTSKKNVLRTEMTDVLLLSSEEESDANEAIFDSWLKRRNPQNIPDKPSESVSKRNGRRDESRLQNNQPLVRSAIHGSSCTVSETIEEDAQFLDDTNSTHSKQKSRIALSSDSEDSSTIARSKTRSRTRSDSRARQSRFRKNGQSQTPPNTISMRSKDRDKIKVRRPPIIEHLNGPRLTRGVNRISKAVECVMEDSDDDVSWLDSASQKMKINLNNNQPPPGPIKLVKHGTQKTSRLGVDEDFSEFRSNVEKFTEQEDKALLTFLDRQINDASVLENDEVWFEIGRWTPVQNFPWQSLKARYFELKQYKDLSHLGLSSSLLKKLNLHVTPAAQMQTTRPAFQKVATHPPPSYLLRTRPVSQPVLYKTYSRNQRSNSNSQSDVNKATAMVHQRKADRREIIMERESESDENTDQFDESLNEVLNHPAFSSASNRPLSKKPGRAKSVHSNFTECTQATDLSDLRLKCHPTVVASSEDFLNKLIAGDSSPDPLLALFLPKTNNPSVAQKGQEDSASPHKSQGENTPVSQPVLGVQNVINVPSTNLLSEEEQSGNQSTDDSNDKISERPQSRSHSIVEAAESFVSSQTQQIEETLNKSDDGKIEIENESIMNSEEVVKSLTMDVSAKIVQNKNLSKLLETDREGENFENHSNEKEPSTTLSQQETQAKVAPSESEMIEYKTDGSSKVNQKSKQLLAQSRSSPGDSSICKAGKIPSQGSDSRVSKQNIIPHKNDSLNELDVTADGEITKQSSNSQEKETHSSSFVSQLSSTDASDTSDCGDIDVDTNTGICSLSNASQLQKKKDTSLEKWVEPSTSLENVFKLSNPVKLNSSQYEQELDISSSADTVEAPRSHSSDETLAALADFLVKEKAKEALSEVLDTEESESEPENSLPAKTPIKPTAPMVIQETPYSSSSEEELSLRLLESDDEICEHENSPISSFAQELQNISNDSSSSNAMQESVFQSSKKECTIKSKSSISSKRKSSINEQSLEQHRDSDGAQGSSCKYEEFVASSNVIPESSSTPKKNITQNKVEKFPNLASSSSVKESALLVHPPSELQPSITQKIVKESQTLPLCSNLTNINESAEIDWQEVLEYEALVNNRTQSNPNVNKSIVTKPSRTEQIDSRSKINEPLLEDSSSDEIHSCEPPLVDLTLEEELSSDDEVLPCVDESSNKISKEEEILLHGNQSSEEESSSAEEILPCVNQPLEVEASSDDEIFPNGNKTQTDNFHENQEKALSCAKKSRPISPAGSVDSQSSVCFLGCIKKENENPLEQSLSAELNNETENNACRLSTRSHATSPSVQNQPSSSHCLSPAPCNLHHNHSHPYNFPCEHQNLPHSPHNIIPPPCNLVSPAPHCLLSAPCGCWYSRPTQGNHPTADGVFWQNRQLSIAKEKKCKRRRSLALNKHQKQSLKAKDVAQPSHSRSWGTACNATSKWRVMDANSSADSDEEEEQPPTKKKKKTEKPSELKRLDKKGKFSMENFKKK